MKDSRGGVIAVMWPERVWTRSKEKDCDRLVTAVEIRDRQYINKTQIRQDQKRKHSRTSTTRPE